ncbi:HTH cro/C1-type domain-containing protein [Gammaproteobacteria bacterium]
MDENTLKKKVGMKIKQLRAIKGWSRQQAADKLAISVTSYGSIERGETDVGITRLAQIAKLFDNSLFNSLELKEITVFNFIQENQECDNWNFGSQLSEIKELSLKNEIEKCQFIQKAREIEIEHLKQQIIQLQKIIELLEKQ